ncbi:uncharacterized protein EDB91DRAFT_1254546 [Suillus paluster]|uniref:uncharacterized protein n=1 Tax=Suillus paluster TaxID=48578 RepID=UPI001B871F06|nr:uncharacterized protein EDB91DRAFT_1254546 [Suillus paluster]KAG1726033.1 hypothetical protein EDB91DRAFT_1254546 [Suillus paluster]
MPPEISANADVWFNRRKFRHVITARAADIVDPDMAETPTSSQQQRDYVQLSLSDALARASVKRARPIPLAQAGVAGPSRLRSLTPDIRPPRPGLNGQMAIQGNVGSRSGAPPLKRQRTGRASPSSDDSESALHGHMGSVSNPAPPSGHPLPGSVLPLYHALVPAITRDDASSGNLDEAIDVPLGSQGDFSWSCRSSDPDLPRLPLDPQQPLCRWARYWVCNKPGDIPVFVQELMEDIRLSDIPGRRGVVSKKRTRALGDLYNTWKKSQMRDSFENEAEYFLNDDEHVIPWKDLQY